MGIPGVGEIHPGTRFCAIYSGPTERDQLLLPYLREGLRHGDLPQVPRANEMSPSRVTPGPGVQRLLGHG